MKKNPVGKILWLMAAILCSAGCNTGDDGSVCEPSPYWNEHVVGQQYKAMYFYTIDMDNDGKTDIVSASMGHRNEINSEVAWFKNNGTDADWGKIIISSSEKDPVKNTTGVVSADIDGDGHLDVAVATGLTGATTPTPAQVYWFKSPDNASQENWDRTLIFEEPDGLFYKIYAFDANNDNQTDLVVGGKSCAYLLINPGNPSAQGATWETHPLPEGTGSFIFVDDINNDGKPDVISSNLYSATVSWTEIHFADGSFTFTMHIVKKMLSGAFDVFPFDINGDGRKDLVVSRILASGIKWFEAPQASDGFWIEHTISATHKGADVYAGDIDADGVTDFVIAGAAMPPSEDYIDNLSWFSTPDQGVTWVKQTAWCYDTDAPGDIGLADINGDGSLDIVTTGNSEGRVLWYENNIPR